MTVFAGCVELRPSMDTLSHLFQNNRAWVARVRKQTPGFFEDLSRQQSPQYLWIGCSDSRVPANEIVGLLPGELFVHRNVANLVVHTDFNCLSVLQFAVDLLKVRHVIVCGHYGCSGVRAALTGDRIGFADNWLRHLQDVRQKHETRLAVVPEAQRSDKLCELNVVEQVSNVCDTSFVREAWARGQQLAVHGWVYGVQDGHLRDLNFTVESAADEAASYAQALATVFDSAKG